MMYVPSRRSALLGAVCTAVLVGALTVTVETPATSARPAATSNNSNSHDFKLAALGPSNVQKKSLMQGGAATISGPTEYALCAWKSQGCVGF
jgi:hypothetical protein